MMLAAVINSFGDPAAVIEIVETHEPIVGPDSVLISVAAASVNPVDWKVVAGYLQGAIPHHLPLIPGWDVAGTVIGVGPAIKSFAVGDRVAAYAREDHIQFGTYAQRVAVPERTACKIPDGVAFDVAAAVPLAGLTAAQVLIAADVSADDVVLIHAAAGGVGTFATQLARSRGAKVIGTASPSNHEMLKDRGIIPVDYHGDLAAVVKEIEPNGVDVVIDLVGGDALAATPDVLALNGRVVSIIDSETVTKLASEYGYNGFYEFVRPDSKRLAELLEMVASGELIVDVAQRFSLAETAAAMESSKTGQTRGKIVISVEG